jgi:hypothetical protein
MSKIASTRINNDIHEKLVNKCNSLGCNMSNSIKNSIELALDGHLEHDQVNGQLIMQESEKQNTNPENHESNNNYIIRAMPLTSLPTMFQEYKVIIKQ